MALNVEVFASQPPCSGGRLLLRLMDEIKEEYGEKIEVEVYKGKCDQLKKYNLVVSPALVIDEDIQIVGVCPSKQTLKDALREAGIF